MANQKQRSVVMPKSSRSSVLKDNKTKDDYYESAPSHIKKAFAQLKQDGATFNTLHFMCNSLGIPFRTPGWLGDSAVHFVFPKHKVGILIDPGLRKKVLNAKKREFALNGWVLGVINRYEILMMDSDQLKAHLLGLLNISR